MLQKALSYLVSLAEYIIGQFNDEIESGKVVVMS